MAQPTLRNKKTSTQPNALNDDANASDEPEVVGVDSGESGGGGGSDSKQKPGPATDESGTIEVPSSTNHQDSSSNDDGQSHADNTDTSSVAIENSPDDDGFVVGTNDENESNSTSNGTGDGSQTEGWKEASSDTSSKSNGHGASTGAGDGAGSEAGVKKGGEHSTRPNQENAEMDYTIGEPDIDIDQLLEDSDPPSNSGESGGEPEQESVQNDTEETEDRPSAVVESPPGQLSSDDMEFIRRVIGVVNEKDSEPNLNRPMSKLKDDMEEMGKTIQLDLLKEKGYIEEHRIQHFGAIYWPTEKAQDTVGMKVDHGENYDTGEKTHHRVITYCVGNAWVENRTVNHIQRYTGVGDASGHFDVVGFNESKKVVKIAEIVTEGGAEKKRIKPHMEDMLTVAEQGDDIKFEWVTTKISVAREVGEILEEEGFISPDEGYSRASYDELNEVIFGDMPQFEFVKSEEYIEKQKQP